MPHVQEASRRAMTKARAKGSRLGAPGSATRTGALEAKKQFVPRKPVAAAWGRRGLGGPIKSGFEAVNPNLIRPGGARIDRGRGIRPLPLAPPGGRLTPTPLRPARPGGRGQRPTPMPFRPGAGGPMPPRGVAPKQRRPAAPLGRIKRRPAPRY